MHVLFETTRKIKFILEAALIGYGFNGILLLNQFHSCFEEALTQNKVTRRHPVHIMEKTDEMFQ